MSDSNPYRPTEEHEQGVDSGSESTLSHSADAPPRVWPTFAAVLLALVAAVAFQAVIAGILVARRVSEGADASNIAQQIVGDFMSPPVFICLLITGQLSFFLAAVIPARLSSVPFKQRLGLVRPKCKSSDHAFFALGSLIPLAVSLFAVYWVAQLIKPDESLVKLYEGLVFPWGVIFIVMIGLLPGICEELFFRGYMQQRLIQRWGPRTGIVVASFVFALVHITPHAITLAFILGLWLGIIAYRTGAVWSGMICHGFINSSWNVLQVGNFQWGFPKTYPTWAYVVVGLVCTAFFVYAVLILLRLESDKEEAANASVV